MVISKKGLAPKDLPRFPELRIALFQVYRILQFPSHYNGSREGAGLERSSRLRLPRAFRARSRRRIRRRPIFHISEVNSDRTPSPGLIALYEKVYNSDKGKFQAVNVRFTGEREEVSQRVKGWRWHREERRRIARLPCTCGEGDFDMDMCRACWNRDQD